MSQEKIIICVASELKPLIPMFLDHRHEDIRKLRTACQNQDFPALELIGHDLKGLGDSYGFHEITVFGATIEAGAKKRDLITVSENIEKLSRYLCHIEVIYE